jgi:hypothetical protein
VLREDASEPLRNILKRSPTLPPNGPRPAPWSIIPFPRPAFQGQEFIASLFTAYFYDHFSNTDSPQGSVVCLSLGCRFE